MASKIKQPLDELVVEQGLAPSLAQARALIMAGEVVVNDHAIDKPGAPVALTAQIRLKSRPGRYVSRGGTKLEKPLDTFSVDVTSKVVLDVGASTGGFTDCLLQRGACTVYAIDVGYGQLAWKLREDPRVVVFERANICALTQAEIPTPADLAVIDVSFTSLKKIWPPVIALLKPQGALLSLIKPQFEARKEDVEAGGIVRSLKTYQEVMQAVVETAHALKLHVAGIMESPIRGQKGNREFFLYAVIKS
ncbi:MAG: TlyA family RNA methyltransferase [Proteobacteria bacterium]|nr:TlyA family RNA methyltransferase [Pseudomonadota bacterium]